MSLNGKVGIVTGAGSGLGEAGARRLARDGAQLILADRHGDDVDRVAQDITAAGGDATPFVTDVAILDDTKRMVDFAMSTYGRLDVAFNNAGITPQLTDLHEIDPADWLQTMESI